MDTLPEKQSLDLECQFVKSTYDAIAKDFSDTRYKKWPKVDAFLKLLEQSTLLLDIGCGNGKYLDNSRTYNIGCDVSLNLLRICKAKHQEVVLCDMTRLPFKPQVFDSVICIAAIHHITTSKRRQKCLADMVELMDPRASRCLVQVWAFEQRRDKDNPYLRNRRDDKDESCAESSSIRVPVYDNLNVLVHRNKTPFEEQDVLVPFATKSNDESEEDGPRLRYYHVFRDGELDQMFEKIPSIEIQESYYDKGNWCIVAGKGDAILRSS